MSAQIVDQSPFLWLAYFPFFRYGIGGRYEEFGEQLAIRHSNSGTNNSTKLAFVGILHFKLGNLLQGAFSVLRQVIPWEASITKVDSLLDGSDEPSLKHGGKVFFLQYSAPIGDIEGTAGDPPALARGFGILRSTVLRKINGSTF